MKLCQIIAAMKEDVVSAPESRLFETAKEQHPILGDYTSVAEMLSMLGRDDPRDYPAKEAVIRAVLTQHRQGHNRFWSSLIMVVFGRMLCRLRGRVQTDEFDRKVTVSDPVSCHIAR